jgi:hypothetical protein
VTGPSRRFAEPQYERAEIEYESPVGECTFRANEYERAEREYERQVGE